MNTKDKKTIVEFMTHLDNHLREIDTHTVKARVVMYDLATFLGKTYREEVKRKNGKNR